ncbi:MAG: YqaE/Pmp3 family membrane protein [Pseudomonadota bacterium]
MELILIVLALFVPPLAVFFTCGLCKHFWINILLTLLGYLPGVVHAVWYIGRSRSVA